MATNESGFRALLGPEVDIDMEKLKYIACHGVPDKVRGEVWKYLLEVSKPDRSEEMKFKKNQREDYEEALKKQNVIDLRKITGSISRLHIQKQFFQNSPVAENTKNVLIAYLNNNSTHIEYRAGMLHLLAPFMYVIEEPHDCFHCFEALMKLQKNYLSENSMAVKVAYFLTCFRTAQLDLWNHFEQAEVEINAWLPSWFEFLLSRELPLECTLRLWDTYFSCEEGLDLHMYVCLV